MLISFKAVALLAVVVANAACVGSTMPKKGKSNARTNDQLQVASDEVTLSEGITLPQQQHSTHSSLGNSGPVSRAEFNEVVEMLRSVMDVTGSSAVRERQALRDVVDRLEQRALAAQEMFCTQHQKLEKNAAGWRKGLHDEVHAMQQQLLEIRKLAGKELSELKKRECVLRKNENS